ncbi:MAG: hypothetical protein FJY95_00965 [Candidatus Handelsmanbacteria bacterium]|nr:hypothetical protein [Candidatus Handelsmanbacteria bacterium]
MHTLRNDELEVTILEPVADHRLGNLMSGPTSPDAFNWFDGQGIPDAFSVTPAREGLTLVPGIGNCDMEGRKIVEWCQWEVEISAMRSSFLTRQQLGDASLELERTVELSSRSVRSLTRLKNGPKGSLSLRW